MSNFLFDNLHQGIGRVLDLRSAQHALTASNLANADTPGFKAKFIPFTEVLGEVMGTKDSMPMLRSHGLHQHATEIDANHADIEPQLDRRMLKIQRLFHRGAYTVDQRVDLVVVGATFDKCQKVVTFNPSQRVRHGAGIFETAGDGFEYLVAQLVAERAVDTRETV